MTNEWNMDATEPFAEARGSAAPLVMNEIWCDPDCPHFQPPTDCVELNGRCKLLNVPLDYYDWFLAACEYEVQPNETSSATRPDGER